ncbi:MAG: ferric reductase-like transmembrane domain-containing protein [Alphaproteobacteria bacterium]|nr:ferric reductase-like transmembrane domain-containing protein [Alphaproteobacteria bacterium]
MMRQLAVWRDPAGRFSALKLFVLLVLLWPGVDLALGYAMGMLGARPITQLIHGTGDWAVRFLLASLAVTPLRAVLEWSRVVILRRMLGVGAAFYALAHFVLYAWDSRWSISFVASEIVLRFYLTIGFVALLGLTVLMVTSTDGWQKKLRQRWKQLHRLVFPITVLALFHYFLQAKAAVPDAAFALGVFVWLGLWRLAPRRWQGRPALLVGLLAVVPVITALLEAGWFGAATRIPAARVLIANLDLAAGRPSALVAASATAVLAAALVRRWLKSRKARPSRELPRPAAVR